MIEDEDTDPDPPVMVGSHGNDWDPYSRWVMLVALCVVAAVAAFLGLLLGLVIG